MFRSSHPKISKTWREEKMDNILIRFRWAKSQPQVTVTEEDTKKRYRACTRQIQTWSTLFYRPRMLVETRIIDSITRLSSLSVDSSTSATSSFTSASTRSSTASAAFRTQHRTCVSGLSVWPTLVRWFEITFPKWYMRDQQELCNAFLCPFLGFIL